MNPIEETDIKAESEEFCNMNDEEIVNEMNPIEKTVIKAESEEFFHVNDEEIVNDMNAIEKTDIKSESEESRRTNNILGNYDGVTGMIIIVNVLRTFYCCFYVSFQC